MRDQDNNSTTEELDIGKCGSHLVAISFLILNSRIRKTNQPALGKKMLALPLPDQSPF